ncbi:MAG: tRNA (adenosine(37)-N6)-dimethylallyltransferase MiaA [Pseudomonadales bacterium]|nr:tRNA (adenosine(37)-N6)-dimethylallyltransferase MiaA [Pseudomonadales bacterium]
MTAPLPPVIAITGATATGKTEVAIALADQLPVSLISIDSAMVYRGMDIGTAKPEPNLLTRYPHALVDIRDPADTYSAAEFLQDADAAVETALAAGRVPVLVGGTMLYLRSFREGLGAMPAADAGIRGRLQREAQSGGWGPLYQRLERVDPPAAARIHPNNGNRIQRALEVFELTGRPLSSFWAEDTGATRRLGVRLLEFAIQPDTRSALHTRIEQRLVRMFEAGFVEEVAALYRRGDLSGDLPALRSVGYRQVWEYLDGRFEEAEMQRRCLAATRQLAKRQLTWLRSWPEVQPLVWGDSRHLAGQIAAAAQLAFS